MPLRPKLASKACTEFLTYLIRSKLSISGVDRIKSPLVRIMLASEATLRNTEIWGRSTDRCSAKTIEIYLRKGKP